VMRKWHGLINVNTIHAGMTRGEFSATLFTPGSYLRVTDFNDVCRPNAAIEIRSADKCLKMLSVKTSGTGCFEGMNISET
jgi:hypothetical protein